MKRNKEWWARLSRKERKELVYLEKASNNYNSYGGGGYLPDDCSECSFCENPMVGIGLCDKCSCRLNFLIRKASSVTV